MISVSLSLSRNNKAQSARVSLPFLLFYFCLPLSLSLSLSKKSPSVREWCPFAVAKSGLSIICLSVVLTTTTIYYCSQWWPLPQLLSFSAADVPTLLICLIRGVLCRRCCCLAMMCPSPFSHLASHSFIQSFIHSVLCLNLSPIGAPLSSVNGSRSATAAVVVALLSPLFLSDCNN